MKQKIQRYQDSKEYFFMEGCHINELSNQTDDPDVSIARARVEPGVTQPIGIN
jgi:galactitol-specific phosphotransferase system IIB component